MVLAHLDAAEKSKKQKVSKILAGLTKEVAKKSEFNGNENQEYGLKHLGNLVRKD